MRSSVVVGFAYEGLLEAIQSAWILVNAMQHPVSLVFPENPLAGDHP